MNFIRKHFAVEPSGLYSRCFDNVVGVFEPANVSAIIRLLTSKVFVIK